MAVQASATRDIKPFVLAGAPFHNPAATIKQDAARTTELAQYTLMARIAATGLWEPYGDNTATDGTAIPQGIYMGEAIPAASLVAGNVVNCPIIVGGEGLIVDEDQLVIEELVSPPIDLDSLITVGTTDIRTVEEHLRNLGIFMKATFAIDAYEN